MPTKEHAKPDRQPLLQRPHRNASGCHARAERVPQVVEAHLAHLRRDEGGVEPDVPRMSVLMPPASGRLGGFGEAAVGGRTRYEDSLRTLTQVLSREGWASPLVGQPRDHPALDHETIVETMGACAMSEDMTTADIAGRRDDRVQTQDREPRAEQQPRAEEATEAGNGGEAASRLQPSSPLPDGAAEASDPHTDRRGALLAASDAGHFRERWSDVQTHFVDAPREAVQGADALVAELMQHLAETFARERDSLEQQWTRGEDVSTEDLRVALTRYRSFFDRLLEA